MAEHVGGATAPKFALGRIVATPGVLQALAGASENPLPISPTQERNDRS